MIQLHLKRVIADVMLHSQFIEQLVINLDCAINILKTTHFEVMTGLQPFH